jgi:CBS domain-containing protein
MPFAIKPPGRAMSEEIELADASQPALQAVLQKTRVSALTLTRVPILSPEQSLDEAAEQMRKVSHGSALICDDIRLLGIVTERDLLRLLAEDVDFDAPVSRYMTASPRTLSPDDRLAYAVLLMDRGGYRRLPVVDEERCAAGIVDVKTVMNYLVEQVPTTVYNQASSALLSVRNAEGA